MKIIFEEGDIGKPGTYEFYPDHTQVEMDWGQQAIRVEGTLGKRADPGQFQNAAYALALAFSDCGAAVDWDFIDRESEAYEGTQKEALAWAVAKVKQHLFEKTLDVKAGGPVDIETWKVPPVKALDRYPISSTGKKKGTVVIDDSCGVDEERAAALKWFKETAPTSDKYRYKSENGSTFALGSDEEDRTEGDDLMDFFRQRHDV